jgi:hypothetical protein
VVYVNKCSQAIWDVTATECRRIRTTSTGGVEHCDITVQSAVPHSLRFCTGSRDQLFQLLSTNLLPRVTTRVVRSSWRTSKISSRGQCHQKCARATLQPVTSGRETVS